MSAPPLLMLPVRIETRFARGDERPELWVRVFPDQIAVDAHDPRVTDAEIAGAHRYWTARWRAGTADGEVRRHAWKSLAHRFGATRAAYLVHADLLAPTNLAQRPTNPTPHGSAPAPPPDFAAVPAGDKRPASWARAPVARGLPERFTVVLERGGAVVVQATGADVPADLAVGPDPTAPPVPTPDGLAVDEGMRWMVDFEAAEAVGMALRIPIAPADVEAGFDRVLVYGVSPAGGAPAAVTELLRAHRFTDGFGIVKQGTATNNTRDAKSGWRRDDPGFERSFRLEGSDPPDSSDGAVLANLLGLPPDEVARAENADATGQDNALRMTVATWPATFGYFLDQMMSEVVGPASREEARAHVFSRVRARGVIPAIRVGSTPYGVVRTTAFTRFKPVGRAREGEQHVIDGLGEALKRLWPTWRASARGEPHVDPAGDPDDQLVGILGMDASARGYRVRHALDELFTNHAGAWLNVGKENDSLIFEPGKAELAQLGLGTWNPRLIHLAMTTIDRTVPFPIVVDGPLSETDGLPPVTLADGTTGNYISWLAAAPWEDLKDDEHKFPGGPPTALLYKVLRQALLVQLADFAFDVLIENDLADLAAKRAPVFTGFPEPESEAHLPGPTAWQALAHDTPIRPSGPSLVLDPNIPAGSTGPAARVPLGRHIRDEALRGVPRFKRLGELYDALKRLAALPTAELERLFTETLDTYSHRLDPWVSSLASAIEDSRHEGTAPEYRLAAYGWVENLRTRPQPPPAEGDWLRRAERVDRLRDESATEAPPPAPVRMPRKDDTGFVHAPSLTQAAVGAVLRSGYMTHNDREDRDRLSVDLSSGRVGDALRLLEGVRQGQSLGGLLGYRFERGLEAAGLQVLLQPYRDRFPVVANKLTEPSGPVESVAAAGVADGLALHAEWKTGALWSGQPALDAGQRTAVDAILRAIDDSLDAVGDLSITESVFQVLRGNPTRAGGLLDAISRGERPPEPEVVRTPRSGFDLTHRVGLLFAPAPDRIGGWPGAGHPRALAEPRIDAWATHVLPRPAHVRCRVTFHTGSSSGSVEVKLDDLGLGPLDVLELADADPDAPEGSELAQRVVRHAHGIAPPGAERFSASFVRDASIPPHEHTFADLLVAARAVRALAAEGRALEPRDLVPPEHDAAALGAKIDTVELDGRAGAAVAGLETAVNSLAAAASAPDLRDALLVASLYGASGSIPAGPGGSGPEAVAALKAQATRVHDELAKRLADAKAAIAAFDRPTASDEALRDHLVGLIQAVLGRGFRVLPVFTPAAKPDLDAALAQSGSLGAGQNAIARWAAKLVPVQPGVRRWDDVRHLGQAIAGMYPRAPVVLQLPPRDPDRWLALRDAAGHDRGPAGRVALALEAYPHVDTGAALSGLIVDEWPERIPSPRQSTGVAFHFDQPNARAPQALLYGVCPDEREEWDDDALRALLGDTLDVAKARAVELEGMTGLGQLLPTLLFPFNADGETVALGFYDIK